MYTYIESLHYTPETNIMLHANSISIKTNKQIHRNRRGWWLPEAGGNGGGRERGEGGKKV